MNVPPGEILDLASLDPVVDEVLAGRTGIGDDDLQALDGSGFGLDEALADGDRAGRAGRRQLDEARLVTHGVVVVDDEADLVGESGLARSTSDTGTKTNSNFQSTSFLRSSWAGRSSSNANLVIE